MNTSTVLNFDNMESFLSWLEINHATASEAVLYIYKKNAKVKGISYEDAVLAALCYGWIDSTMHSYDGDTFILRFSPRKKNSNWSLSNIKRMKKLIEINLMTEYGLEPFDSGLIEKLPELIATDEMRRIEEVVVPAFVEDLLAEDKVVYERFISLTKAHKYRYLDWIVSAKQEKTKIRRVKKMMSVLKEDMYD